MDDAYKGEVKYMGVREMGRMWFGEKEESEIKDISYIAIAEITELSVNVWSEWG